MDEQETIRILFDEAKEKHLPMFPRYVGSKEWRIEYPKRRGGPIIRFVLANGEERIGQHWGKNPLETGSYIVSRDVKTNPENAEEFMKKMWDVENPPTIYEEDDYNSLDIDVGGPDIVKLNNGECELNGNLSLKESVFHFTWEKLRNLYIQELIRRYEGNEFSKLEPITITDRLSYSDVSKIFKGIGTVVRKTEGSFLGGGELCILLSPSIYRYFHEDRLSKEIIFSKIIELFPGWEESIGSEWKFCCYEVPELCIDESEIALIYANTSRIIVTPYHLHYEDSTRYILQYSYGNLIINRPDLVYSHIFYKQK
ncbi:MAG: hypothetical protein F4X29_05260 [Rhodothermaceae bacterium]|nr:hypothetical protein [Rhodothermaceae bacterium]